MNTISSSILSIFCVWILLITNVAAQSNENCRFEIIKQMDLGQKIGSLRAVPVNLSHTQKALLYIYSADKEIDPWEEMFYIPTDPLKFALYSLDGELIWKKVLGKGTLNGMWFTPVFPFDLDGDGTDEIYFVENTDSVHILSTHHQHLSVLDAKTGNLLSRQPWKRFTGDESLSHTYRNFIFGGYAKGKPTLITAAGTYGTMGLIAWEKHLKKRWELVIDAKEFGPKGSHMCPVVDINNDSIDEIFWGERCINLHTGEYVFIADKEVYNGHSDVIQPTFDRQNKSWSLFTCRESGDNGEIKPRVIMFNDKGNRIWTDLEKGHMDMGWTAHTQKNKTIAFTISRGGKMAGPQGFMRTGIVEYCYDAKTGAKITLPFKAYNTIPIDLNGDGYHEFASALGEQSDRNVYGFDGSIIGKLGDNAYIAIASNFLNLAGEQLLCYYPDGKIKIWADVNAKESNEARKRYSHPYYTLMQKYTAVGYNLVELGGL